jgi:fibronectin type 3 domain-containing protein
VTVNWSPVAGASTYSVLRSTASGGPYTVAASGVSGTSFTDTGLTNDTKYYYVVSATNGCGPSGNSAEVNATPIAANPAPLAPTNLAASGARRKVNLTWMQSTSAGVTQNKIYRSTTSGSGYGLVATVNATTSYADTSVSSRIKYYYVVTAVRNGVESVRSNQASATPR